MKITESFLNGCFLIAPTIYKDKRGEFFEFYNQKSFEKLIGNRINFVQDNQSLSKYGVIRGLHFQSGPYAQAKLLRVLKGEVLDIVLDIRKDSPTFGQYNSVILNEENKHLLFIPRGFAHGFSVLSEEAIFAYKCDNYYHAASESGIIYNDKRLNIDWKINQDEITLSPKDKELQTFDQFSRKTFMLD